MESEKNSNEEGEGKDQEWKKTLEEILSLVKVMFEEICGRVRTAELRPKILKESVEPTKHDEELENRKGREG